MARWLIDKAGVQLTVKTKSAAAEPLITIALGAMNAERVRTTHGIALNVTHEKEGDWLLEDRASNLARKLNQSGDLIYHLTDRIVFHIADKAEQAHCLHAASVAKQGNVLVIPANSGAGKSTFTTWLVANGFDYLTDELILIDDGRNVEGIARPIQIKSHGLNAVKKLIKDDKLVQPGKLVNALPLGCVGGQVSSADSHQLVLFVFPHFKKGSDFSFTQLSSAQAGMSLMGNHVNARNLDGHGFRDMMDIIRNTPCYALEYGGFDTLPVDFPRQLEALLEQNG